MQLNIQSEWVSFDRYCNLLDRMENNDCSIYHRPLWLNIIASSFNVKILAIHSYTIDGETLALTPFMLKKKGPFHIFGAPLSGMYTEFSGPIFANGMDVSEMVIVARSQHSLLIKKSDYIEWGAKGINGSIASWGKDMLTKFKYVLQMRPSILIDLTLGEKALWNGLEGRARNMVRKAEKLGVEINIIEPTESWIDDYYQMLKDTYSRQGRRVPHPHLFFQNLKKLQETGNAYFVAAKMDGCMIAGAIFLIDNLRMLYLSGTANASGLQFAAPSLLQWYAIKKAIMNGLEEYDMGGLGIPSIDIFKRSFGGAPVTHHRWVYRSAIFRIVDPVGRWLIKKGLVRFNEL